MLEVRCEVTVAQRKGAVGMCPVEFAGLDCECRSARVMMRITGPLPGQRLKQNTQTHLNLKKKEKEKNTDDLQLWIKSLQLQIFFLIIADAFCVVYTLVNFGDIRSFRRDNDKRMEVKLSLSRRC